MLLRSICWVSTHICIAVISVETTTVGEKVADVPAETTASPAESANEKTADTVK